jgi:hypothetical protein
LTLKDSNQSVKVTPRPNSIGTEKADSIPLPKEGYQRVFAGNEDAATTAKRLSRRWAHPDWIAELVCDSFQAPQKDA